MAFYINDANLSELLITDGQEDTLKNICQSGNINIWSLYKPVNSSKQSALLENDYATFNYGITITSNYDPLSVYPSNSSEEYANWVYTKPSSVYRISDLKDYNHNAAKPINILSAYTITGSTNPVQGTVSFQLNDESIAPTQFKYIISGSNHYYAMFYRLSGSTTQFQSIISSSIEEDLIGIDFDVALAPGTYECFLGIVNYTGSEGYPIIYIPGSKFTLNVEYHSPDLPYVKVDIGNYDGDIRVSNYEIEMPIFIWLRTDESQPSVSAIADVVCTISLYNNLQDNIGTINYTLTDQCFYSNGAIAWANPVYLLVDLKEHFSAEILSRTSKIDIRPSLNAVPDSQAYWTYNLINDTEYDYWQVAINNAGNNQ